VFRRHVPCAAAGGMADPGARCRDDHAVVTYGHHVGPSQAVADVATMEAGVSHPNTQESSFDGIDVKAKAFRTNAFVYRSIGGAVEVRGRKKSRSWKCLWLCKKREKIKADRIRLENQYFSRVEGTAVLVASANHEGVCTTTADCTLKHSAGGIAVKITFPRGSTTPGTVDDLLPLDGVVSRATVTVRGRQFSFVTASGAHPEHA